MSIKTLAALVSLSLSFSLFGCHSRPAAVQTEAVGTAHPWTSLSLNNAPRDFHFGIIADRTGGARPGVFESGVEAFNRLQPEFVINVGDTIEGNSENEPTLRAQRQEFDAIASRLQMPFFIIPGNHDVSNAVKLKLWRERFGTTHYYFIYRDVLFLVLCTEDALKPGDDGFIGPEQTAYFMKVLAAHKNVRWTMVFMHKPVWLANDGGGWSQIEAELAKRPYTVIAGHTHSYAREVRNGHEYIIMSTSGGASGMRGPLYGEFDHLMWVTMKDNGPVFANLMLDGIKDQNIRSAETAAAVAKLGTGIAVEQDKPALVEGGTFTQATTEMHFHNNLDLPVTFAGDIVGSDLRVSPGTIKVEVPANSERKVELSLATTQPTAVEKLHPAKFQFQFSADMGAGGPISLDGSMMIGADRLFKCPAAARPVKVDGDLAEWGELPYACPRCPCEKTDAERANSSFRFATAHDDRYVYIAVEVADDKLVQIPGKNLWDQDAVEVRIDARPEPRYGNSEFTKILPVILAPGETAATTRFDSKEKEPEGTQAVCVKTAKGYNAEIAIPVKYFNEKQNGSWSDFRLNICVDDLDAAGAQVHKLWWRPSWRTGETYAGTGTFKKE